MAVLLMDPVASKDLLPKKSKTSSSRKPTVSAKKKLLLRNQKPRESLGLSLRKNSVTGGWIVIIPMLLVT